MLVVQENVGSRTDPQHLLSRAQHGDVTQLGKLLDTYRTYLGLLADTQLDRKLRARISPSDIVQESMLEAHRDFPQFRGQSEREFLAWLRRILANTLARAIEMHVLTKKRDVRRDVSLEKVVASNDQSTMQFGVALAANCETPSSGARRRERAVILADVMRKLTPDQREVLMLRNVRGLQFKEVANQMNRSVAASKMLWMRAIKRLRELYEGRDAG